jgi:hypothetical protein
VIGFYLSTNGLNCHASLTCFFLLFRLAGGGEDLGAHVAAGLGPFVVLLGQDRADKADDGLAGGEDADDIGPPAYFLIEALPGYLESSRGCLAR